jgi:peptidoglycan/LPS O-acetylase OafA/YrhL
MRLRSIQVLRGIAALAVVVCHAASTAPKHGIAFPFITDRSIGEWGVDIFFVISGFIMVFITTRHAGTWADTRDFWTRRFFRIAPLYWLVSSFVLANAVLGQSDYRPTLDHVAASFLFVPWNDARGQSWPVLRVGWTLDFEMYFYLVFGLLLLIPHTLRWLLIWATVSVLIGLVLHPITPWAQMLTSALLLEFLAGAAIGHAYLKGLRFPWAAVGAILALGAFLLSDVLQWDAPKVFRFGIPAAVLVFSMLTLEDSGRVSFSSGPFLLGEWSYSLYLVHVPILAVCGKVAEMTHITSPAFLLLEILVTVAVAAVTYRLLEKPMHQYLQPVAT